MDSETSSHNLRMVALSLTNSYTDTHTIQEGIRSQYKWTYTNNRSTVPVIFWYVYTSFLPITIGSHTTKLSICQQAIMTLRE